MLRDRMFGRMYDRQYHGLIGRHDYLKGEEVMLMRELGNLKRLMVENGLLGAGIAKAASLEIIPFVDDLLHPDGSLNLSKPKDPVQEGGGCTYCDRGCSAGCFCCCGTGCMEGCTMGNAPG